MMGSLVSARVWRIAALSIVCIGAFVVGSAWAATTGKIAGRVTDAESGEPIPGVTVIIEGMRLGATTDPDGAYFIIGIPPGFHDVRAAIIGYVPVTMTRVEVNIDRTTPLDFSLATSTIQVEGVTIVAEREVIKLDVGSSRAVLTSDDVLELPTLANLASAIAREPGVGGSTVRGGLAEETQLMLNGHYLTDVRLNTVSAGVIPITSVQEVQVLKSGFNAEYGNARSGVISVVTRDDVRRHWFNSRIVYTPAQKQHWTTDAYGNSAPSAYGESTREWHIYGREESITDSFFVPNLATPDIPDDSVSRFNGWYSFVPPFFPDSVKQERSRKMLEYWRHRHALTEDDYANKPSYTIDVTVGGPVPLAKGMSFAYSHRNTYSLYMLAAARPAYTDFTEQLTLTQRIGSAKIALMGGYTGERGLANASFSASTKYALYQGLPFENRTWFGGATFTHVLSTATNYEFSLDYQKKNYNTSMWEPRYVTTSTGERVPNELYADHTIIAAGLDTAAWGAGIASWMGGDPYGVAPYGHAGNYTYMDEGNAQIGHQYNLSGSYDNTDSSSYDTYKLRGSLVSQVTPNHQVKTGFEATFTELRERQMWQYYSDWHYVWYTQNPTQISGYIQDKMEYEGMVMNAGVRLDYFDSNANVYDRENPFSPHWKKDLGWPYHSDHDLYHWLDTSAVHHPDEPLHYEVDKAKSRMKLAPRLAISHPITDKSKIFFNYGHFYNYPRNTFLYWYNYNPSGTGVGPVPNPELDFPRTIQYELGIEHEFTNGLWAGLFGWETEPQVLVSVAGYYKDVTNEVALTEYLLTRTDATQRPENKTYAQIRGVELRLHKRVGRFFTGYFQGEWSLRDQGNVGYVRKDALETDVIPEQAYQQTSVAEPVWSLYLDVHTPRQFSAFGLPASVTELWSAKFNMSYAQGQQWTYNPGNDSPPPPLNVRYRDSWGSSLTFAKGFSYAGLTGEASMAISNVFGYKTLWSGSMTGQEWNEYLKSLHFPIDDVAIETNKGNDRVGDYPSYANIPVHDGWAHFLSPRTVTFALNLWFN